jgi:hypothetical protein
MYLENIDPKSFSRSLQVLSVTVIAIVLSFFVTYNLVIVPIRPHPCDYPGFEWTDTPHKRRKWKRVEALLDTSVGSTLGPDVCSQIWEYMLEMEKWDQHDDDRRRVLVDITRTKGRNNICYYEGGDFYWPVVRINGHRENVHFTDQNGVVSVEDAFELDWLDGSRTLAPAGQVAEDCPTLVARYMDILLG